jgi:hypothetical protein
VRPLKIALIGFLFIIPSMSFADDDPHDYQGDAVYWREQAETLEQQAKDAEQEKKIQEQDQAAADTLKQIEDIRAEHE